MSRSAISVTLTGLAWLASAPLHADPTPVAVFDMSFINFSQEVDYGATNEAEHARIAMLNQHLRERLDESGRFRVVDPAPVSAELAMHGEAFTCNHCEAALARKLGAGLSITGAVQKMSVLVQTVILRERDGLQRRLPIWIGIALIAGSGLFVFLREKQNARRVARVAEVKGRY